MTRRRPVNRLNSETVPHTFKAQGNRASIKTFAAQCTPLFIYNDRGTDWVRWDVPLGLFPSLENMHCPDCGKSAHRTVSGGLAIDTAYRDVRRTVYEVTS